MELQATALSRRTFLKAAASTGALAGVAGLGAAGLSDAPKAHAEDSVSECPTLCNACSSKCGLMVKVKAGRLWEVHGQKDHPNSKGKVCARGHGFTRIAYAEERVVEPLKRLDDGTFQAIGWGQAMEEIGQKTKDVIDRYGAESVSFINDPRPTGKVYGKNFIHALGSNNFYSHAAACDLSRTTGYYHVLGTNSFGADLSNAKMVLFIGRSYGDGIRPSSVAALTKMHEAGSKIVLVDPRLNNTAVFADTWLPIRPGTDLALLLALANVLIKENLYNHDFIEQQTYGFEEWAEAISGYTPEWASGITDLDADDITTLARDMAAAAPRSVIEPGWHAAHGVAYANSSETSRAVCMVNALLGNWNQKGGALITGTPKAGSIDKAKFPTPATPAGKRSGDVMFPLVDPEAGSALAVLQEALDGKAHAVFFYNSNAMQGYANPDVWTEGMSHVDLKVSIEVQMSETAMQCDYVLPECSYLERTELPEWIGGASWNVGLRTQVLEKIHPETKPSDEIFNMLAQACGVGGAFTYTAEDLGRAQIESLGLSYDELKKKGTLKVDGSPFVYGVLPKWNTPSGKLQFKSPAHEAAGFDPLVHWVEPARMPEEGEFRLIAGKQGIHSHTMTMNNDILNAISRDYDMERVWINADVASEYGLADGDMVELSNSINTGRVRIRTTQRLRKDTLFLPAHYGGRSPYLTKAYGYGLTVKSFHEFECEPGVGAGMENEVVVTLKKVNE